MRIIRRKAFTLVELLVVIMIIVTLLGLLIPTCGGGRETARILTCKNNLKQLQMALVDREAAHGEFPGYLNTLGSAGSKRMRASWVVTIFPYLEQKQLWDQWDEGKYAYPTIELLLCPSDPPVALDQPDLSYTANAGYLGNSSGIENRANGVFFDRTSAASPELRMTLKYLQNHDGTTHTLSLTDNVNAIHWGYTSPDDQEGLAAQKYHFGFCWEQPSVLAEAIKNDSPEKVRRINGSWDDEEITFQTMSPNDGFPSSNHPEVVNVAFVDGSVSTLSDQIDPLVYAQLMTSNAKLSDLTSADGKQEKELKPPSENEY